MLKIKVEHLIGDIVKNSLSEARLKVIGYSYIDGELRYVCMQSDKSDLLYCYPAELEHGSETFIGFNRN